MEPFVRAWEKLPATSSTPIWTLISGSKRHPMTWRVEYPPGPALPSAACCAADASSTWRTSSPDMPSRERAASAGSSVPSTAAACAGLRWLAHAVPKGLPDIAHHVIGCQPTQETRVSDALDDAAGNRWQASPCPTQV